MGRNGMESKSMQNKRMKIKEIVNVNKLKVSSRTMGNLKTKFCQEVERCKNFENVS